MPPSLLQALAQDGSRLFTTSRAQELAVSVQLAPAYVPQALHHLARSGWILRVKPGLYALSSDLFGGAPIHEFELAMAMVQPAAISHWSALHHHGLTDQVPHTVFVSVPYGVNPPRLRETNAAFAATFHFVRIQAHRFFGLERAWFGETRVHVTDRERTLLDGLRQPRYCGGFCEVLQAFEQAVPQLDLERITDYALRLDGATARRLGWVLEHFGVPEAQLVRLAQLSARGYQPLDSSAPRRGPCHARWQLQENLPGRIAS